MSMSPLACGRRATFAIGVLGMFAIDAGGSCALAASVSLTDITATADQICNLVRTEGSSDSVKYSGQVKAEVDGLLRKLGLSAEAAGSAERTSSSYQGVLQSELVAALRDNANCKLHVFDTLVKALQ